MTVPDPGRRRLIGLLAVVAAAVAGGLGWALRPSPDSPPGTTLAAPGTTSTTSTSTTTTTAAPTTTTEAETTTTTSTQPPTTTTAAPATPLAVIARVGWGAAEVRGELRPHSIERMTVHHTAAYLAVNADAPSHIRSHQVFHQRDRGWPDLAYHYMIDAEGNVYEGRDHNAVGDTATTYDPTGHLLICCEGHFDEQPFPDAQREALAAMLAWGATEFSVDPSTIGGHRDLASTSCPGDNIYRLISSGDLARQVEDVRAAGGVTLDRLGAEDSIRRVAAVEQG